MASTGNMLSMFNSMINCKIALILLLSYLTPISLASIHNSRYSETRYNSKGELIEPIIHHTGNNNYQSQRRNDVYISYPTQNQDILETINQPYHPPAPPQKPKKFKNAAGYETQLIKFLMEDYDKSARPVIEFDTPVLVNFSLSLTSIDDMDIKNQVLKTGIWINYLWKDEYLMWKPEEWGGVKDIRIPIDDIWRPDIILYNSAGSSDNFDPAFKTVAKILHTGVVNWLPPAQVETSCNAP